MKKTYSRKAPADEYSSRVLQPSFATWSNQRLSRAKKKLVRRVLRERTESPTPKSQSSCLTPEKSLRVNRTPDAFDLLLAGSPKCDTPVRRNDQITRLSHDSISPEKSKNYPKKYLKVNITSDDETGDKLHCSTDSNIENDVHYCNTSLFPGNVTVQKSLTRYNLQVEPAAKDMKIFSESMNIFLSSLVQKHSSDGLNEDNKILSTPVKRPLPHTSTPYLQKQFKYSMNNFSPIMKNVNPQKNTVTMSRSASDESHSKENQCTLYPSTIPKDVEIIHVLHNATKPEIEVTGTFNDEDNIKGIQNINFEIKDPEAFLIKANSSVEPFLGFTVFTASFKANTSDDIFDSADCNNKCSINNVQESTDSSVVSQENITNGRPRYNKQFIDRTNNLLTTSELNETTDSYNTCSSSDKTNNTYMLDPNENIKDARVCIKRLKNSIFEEYFKKFNQCHNDSISLCENEINIEINKPRVCIEKLRDSLVEHYLKNVYDLTDYSISSEDNINFEKNEIITCKTKESNGSLCQLDVPGTIKKKLLTENIPCNIPSTSKSVNTSMNSINEDVRHQSCASSDSDHEWTNNSNLNIKDNPQICIFRESIDISSESDSSEFVNFDNSQRSLCSSNNSIESNTSQYQIIENRQSNQRMTSFVTTRKRNEVLDESVMFMIDSYRDNSPVKTNIDNTITDNANESHESSECSSTEDSVISIKERENKTEADGNGENKIEADGNGVVCETGNQNYADQTEMSTTDKLEGESLPPDKSLMDKPTPPSVVWKAGKKWERSLSMYRRQTMLQESTIYEDAIQEECSPVKRDGVVNTAMQNNRGTLYFNDSAYGRRESVFCKPRRSTIRIVKEAHVSRSNYSVTAVVEDGIGFLSEDCDDTLVELSRLSISDKGLDVALLDREACREVVVERAATALDVVLKRCNQTEVLPFDECYPDTVLKNCTKIGEGVYGEVFLFRGRDGRGRIMKVVPVEGDITINGEHQKTFQEVISEIVIAMELSALRAPIVDIERHCDEGGDISELDLSAFENATDTFNEVLAVRCVYGSYPARLLDLWCLYDEANDSENDSPDILPPMQQFIILELANAGKDLESYEFNNAEQAYALFYQVAFALAVGEESYQFEHRDLHWGNVLIAPTDQKFARYVLRGRPFSVARRGVAATIIDYTLSRVSLPLAAGESATLYNDLSADGGLFEGHGDLQFDVYRHMRSKTGNDWKNFEPYTNVLWLHYTVDKMITAARYKRTNTKIHKHYIAKLKGVKNRILEYGSAVQFVLTDNEF